uniref:Uncharacterized protein n=1 Tax=Arion vulgaris TaxID=1028688 RepID=A0A0B6ZV94_9EUPU
MMSSTIPIGQKLDKTEVCFKMLSIQVNVWISLQYNELFQQIILVMFSRPAISFTSEYKNSPKFYFTGGAILCLEKWNERRQQL